MHDKKRERERIMTQRKGKDESRQVRWTAQEKQSKWKAVRAIQEKDNGIKICEGWWWARSESASELGSRLRNGKSVTPLALFNRSNARIEKCPLPFLPCTSATIWDLPPTFCKTPLPPYFKQEENQPNYTHPTTGLLMNSSLQVDWFERPGNSAVSVS